MIHEVNKRLPEVTSVTQDVQVQKASPVMGDETIRLWGKEATRERINEVTFDFSPHAFFQLNPQQTGLFHDEGIRALDVQPSKTIAGTYCGVETIDLSITRQAKEVWGMDTAFQTIADAKKNAKRLGYHNTRYEAGTAEQVLPKWLNEDFQSDGIIVDPPRTGLDNTLTQSSLKYPSKKLVYISYNVSTLARDLVNLSKKFKIEYLQSVDIFPQTARCEIVMKMTRLADQVKEVVKESALYQVIRTAKQK